MIMMKVNVWSSRSELKLSHSERRRVSCRGMIIIFKIDDFACSRCVAVYDCNKARFIWDYRHFSKRLEPGFVFFYRAFFLSHYPFKYFMSSSFNCTCNKHLLLIRLFYFILLQAYVRFHPYFVMYTFLLMLVDFISLSKINGSILLRLAWDVIYKKQFCWTVTFINIIVYCSMGRIVTASSWKG